MVALTADQFFAMVAAVPAGYANAQAELVRLIGTDLTAAESFVRESDPYGIVGSSALAELASNRTPEELQALFARVDRAVPDGWLAREESLNELGYALLMNGRPLQAVAVFEGNAARHPRGVVDDLPGVAVVSPSVILIAGPASCQDALVPTLP